MRIAELPDVPQNPKKTDVIAISVNGVTYKVSISALTSGLDVATVAETKAYLGIG